MGSVAKEASDILLLLSEDGGQVLRASIIIGAMVLAGNLSGCDGKGIGNVGKGGPMTERSIEEVLKDKTNEWMSIDGVEGVAIGEHKGKSCIIIFTSINPKNLQDKIPSSVEGYPVIIEKTGRFRALKQND